MIASVRKAKKLAGFARNALQLTQKAKITAGAVIHLKNYVFNVDKDNNRKSVINVTNVKSIADLNQTIKVLNLEKQLKLPLLNGSVLNVILIILMT